MRQIECANPKLRFWNAQVIVKIITRASRVAPLRRRTQIANTFAFAGKVSRGILIICVPLIMPRRGKLRTLRCLKNGARWGCPENHDFLFCQLKTKIVNGNNFSQKRKSQFSFLPSICRRAYAERVNLCALYNKRALNNGAPENRNAQSGVRFLGKRSNKHTRTWRQL